MSDRIKELAEEGLDYFDAIGDEGDKAYVAAIRELLNRRPDPAPEMISEEMVQRACDVYNNFDSVHVDGDGAHYPAMKAAICAVLGDRMPRNIDIYDRTLKTSRRVAAVEVLISLGYKWDGQKWSLIEIGHHPAPVGVGVPDATNAAGSTSYGAGFEDGWNSCREETLRLNPQPGAVVGNYAELANAMDFEAKALMLTKGRDENASDVGLLHRGAVAIRALTNTDKGAN